MILTPRMQMLLAHMQENGEIRGACSQPIYKRRCEFYDEVNRLMKAHQAIISKKVQDDRTYKYSLTFRGRILGRFMSDIIKECGK